MKKTDSNASTKVKTNAKVETKKQPSLKSTMNKEQMALFQNASLVSRAMLASRLGQQFNGDRNLYDSFGYERNPNYDIYRTFFDRMGLATRCVEIFPDDTWRKPPILVDGKERSDTPKDSAFLKGWQELADKLKIWQIFRQVDVMCGLGKFAVLFLGAPGNYDTPANDSALAFLSAYDESQVAISSWVRQNTDPHYGMPEKYSIKFQDFDEGTVESKFVHYTRVIHVSENRLGSRVYGRPRLQTVLNRLFDFEKVTGGAAEAAWLSLFKGIIISAKEGAEMPAEGSPEMANLEAEMTAFANRMQRYLRLTAADVKDLGTDTITVRDTYDVLADDLAASLGIPKRILYGSERGELASTQDLRQWAGRITSRQTNFAEPEILRPFIYWCIIHKILPPPTSGHVDIHWPELYELTMGEKAKIALDVGDGAFRATNGAPELVISPDEWRSIIGLPPRSEETIAGTEILPTPTGTVGNRPGKDETDGTVEAKPKV
jgi:hypothetical protein